jgi:hypothetical protein
MRIRLIAIVGAVAILVVIIELVRRRKLKEEYSLLWVVTATLLVVLASWSSLLGKLTHLIGGTLPSSTLFFFGLVFVFALVLHFSVRISILERRVTALVQELGLFALESQTPPLDGPDPEPGDIPDAPAFDSSHTSGAPSVPDSAPR